MAIVELNIARLLAPIGDPMVAGFVDAIDEINALAESHDGFIWRLKDESGHALDLNFNDDPLVITNMSVWRDVASLKVFTFDTVHRNFFARRAEWMEKMQLAHFVMWPVFDEHVPSLEEAREKLEKYRKNGDSFEAFGCNGRKKIS